MLGGSADTQVDWTSSNCSPSRPVRRIRRTDGQVVLGQSLSLRLLQPEAANGQRVYSSTLETGQRFLRGVHDGLIVVEGRVQ